MFHYEAGEKVCILGVHYKRRTNRGHYPFDHQVLISAFPMKGPVAKVENSIVWRNGVIPFMEILHRMLSWPDGFVMLRKL